MAHPYHHALSSVKKWGGEVSDYLPLHSWFDQSKAIAGDFRHRALRHHAEGIFMLVIWTGKPAFMFASTEVHKISYSKHFLRGGGGGMAGRGPLATKLSLFVPLSDEDVRVLDGMCLNEERFKADTDIVREGDVPRSAFVLTHGMAFRYRLMPDGKPCHGQQRINAARQQAARQRKRPDCCCC